MDDEAHRIGQRARRFRRAQGKSLDVIAGQAGIAKGYLSMLEQGKRRWDSRRLTDSVAGALGVKSTDLVGPLDAVGSARRDLAHVELAPLYRALVSSSPEFGSDARPRSLAQLRALDAELTEVWQAHKYHESIQVVIPLLLESTQLATMADSAERTEALWLQLQTLRTVSSICRTFGELPQAMLAAERCLQVAQILGDPVAVAWTAFPRIHALTPDGLYRPAQELGARALSALETPQTDHALEIRGAVLLASAFASSQAGARADCLAMLYEAEEIAGRTGEVGIRAGNFGPSNVSLHRMSIEVEHGDHEETIRIGQRVNIRAVQSANRRATYFAEMGRAKAALGADEEALQLFQRAERQAPLVVRRNPYVKDVVADMLDSRRRLAGGPALIGLAGRLGVL